MLVDTIACLLLATVLGTYSKNNLEQMETLM
jgi:hypothetical protein